MRYEMLMELLRREKEAGIKPDSEIDAFMKATAVSGQETSLGTDYMIKVHWLNFKLLHLQFQESFSKTIKKGLTINL